jgi:hypothetical protein
MVKRGGKRREAFNIPWCEIWNDNKDPQSISAPLNPLFTY